MLFWLIDISLFCCRCLSASCMMWWLVCRFLFSCCLDGNVFFGLWCLLRMLVCSIVWICEDVVLVEPVMVIGYIS